VLAPALRRALPERWARLFATRGLPTRASGWAWALAALVVGAFTHVLLDGFTHYWLWPARALYPHIYVSAFGVDVRLTRVLQHATSIVASIACIAWARARTRRCPPTIADERWRVHLARGVAIAIACLVAGIALGVAMWGRPMGPREYAVLVCPACSLAFVGVTIAARRLI
jgi:hypothetical protein